MNWIQALLILSIVALLVYLLRSRTSARTKAWVKVGGVLFVIAAIYAILRPDDTTVVANWLGVDRGADLIGYVLIIAFVFTTLSTYMRFKDLELRYARLARAVALQGVRVPDEALGVLVAEECDGFGDTVFELHLRSPAEHRFCAADVEAGAPKVAEPRRVKLRLVGLTGRGGDRRM